MAGRRRTGAVPTILRVFPGGLLWLTVIFVMMAEILIFMPSISSMSHELYS